MNGGMHLIRKKQNRIGLVKSKTLSLDRKAAIGGANFERARRIEGSGALIEIALRRFEDQLRLATDKPGLGFDIRDERNAGLGCGRRARKFDVTFDLGFVRDGVIFIDAAAGV
jgi:hypothetical protein